MNKRANLIAAVGAEVERLTAKGVSLPPAVNMLWQEYAAEYKAETFSHAQPKPAKPVPQTNDTLAMLAVAEKLSAQIRATRIELQQEHAIKGNPDAAAVELKLLRASVKAMSERPIIVNNTPTIEAVLTPQAESFQVSLNNPAPVFNVPAPIINIPAPVVNVSAPDVNITNDVRPAPVVVAQPKTTTTTTTVNRDDQGYMTGSVAREKHEYSE